MSDHQYLIGAINRGCALYCVLVTQMSSRHLLLDLPDWWEDRNKSLQSGCEDFYRCYWYYLCVIYGALSMIALIQLIRIQIRLPHVGWTTQKVFQLLNVIICSLRALTFGLYEFMDDLEDAISSYVLQLLIFDLPSLLFFTNYTLWVLFWAEIYYQAGSKETRKFRPYFWIINLAIYMFQGYLWLFTIPDSSRNTVRYISAIWLAIVFLAGTIGFVIYGRTLFLMLQKYPPSFPGRNRKLQDIVGIATVCAFAFTSRAAFLVMFALDKHDFDVDLMHDDLLNIVFYSVSEILPIVCVLVILRRLPPRRNAPPTPLEMPNEDRTTPLND